MNVHHWHIEAVTKDQKAVSVIAYRNDNLLTQTEIEKVLNRTDAVRIIRIQYFGEKPLNIVQDENPNTDFVDIS